MKVFALVCAILLCCSAHAQKPLFLRIYDLNGHIIDRGRIIAITDTTILIAGGPGPDLIYVKNIGSIKTKRAPGHNIAIGAATGLVAATAIAAVSESQTKSEGAVQIGDSGEIVVASAILGAGFGALIGGITASLKHSKHFEINGDLKQWKLFQSVMDENVAE